ncbi:MAG: hypothetical protein DRH08_08960 [Deltaproteobacteria bacterium]|nr:MAG: hypothetical protein DRH08_08960 [Deltaproteobacteria bacterium]
MTILKRLMGLALLGFLVTACSSTTVKDSWVKPGYSNKIENIYLIGIAKEEDYRRIFEETFKRQLTEQGVRAVTSHNDLPKDQENSRENIIQAMTANGCDSVLLTKLVRKRRDAGTKGQGIQVVKTSPVILYGDPWYNSWGSYYDQSYSVVNIQPTTPDAITLTIESVLYDLKTKERIWAAQLETVEEIDTMKMIRDYVEAVTMNLKGKGLI